MVALKYPACAFTPVSEQRGNAEFSGNEDQAPGIVMIDRFQELKRGMVTQNLLEKQSYALGIESDHWNYSKFWRTQGGEAEYPPIDLSISVAVAFRGDALLFYVAIH